MNQPNSTHNARTRPRVPLPLLTPPTHPTHQNTPPHTHVRPTHSARAAHDQEGRDDGRVPAHPSRGVPLRDSPGRARGRGGNGVVVARRERGRRDSFSSFLGWFGGSLGLPASSLCVLFVCSRTGKGQRTEEKQMDAKETCLSLFFHRQFFLPFSPCLVRLVLLHRHHRHTIASQGWVGGWVVDWIPKCEGQRPAPSYLGLSIPTPPDAKTTPGAAVRVLAWLVLFCSSWILYALVVLTLYFHAMTLRLPTQCLPLFRCLGLLVDVYVHNYT